ncbi:NACHT domain-containing NTPase [Streptomyces sp. C3-3]|uniref:NACHT domain-containing protein n=1 Tax=Streptomyces sp. C3-3 TaxID=2824901 RepID=UPI001B365737|nr:NACHT domain-containing protein [Streptomyces sp. C3-3]MBQ1111675.1 NACHT domain-containing protein [Streptomyces sp. C3-3]
MLAETAALRLGTTVARAAGQWWLGGSKKEQERLLSMEELVRLRVPGVRLQREVRQQFEQMTNAVFDRLEPFLKHAFQRLEEGGQQAVIDAASDTLTQANLSDEALLSTNANSADLTRQIISEASTPVGLSQTETRLYEVLFAECVDYYVRIVRSLPVFEERAAGELLSRTATLGAEVARLLERLPDRSLLAPDGADLDTAFRRTYLELVSRDLDEVELFRRTSDQAIVPRVRLSVTYVSMRATGDDGKPKRIDRSLPRVRPDMSNWEEAAFETSGKPVESALSGSSRVLVRGDAGSGKTTLLRWLAITAARGAFMGDLTDWNGLTPIFIKLREYSGRTLPTPEAMLDGIASPITGIMPRGWVERQLSSSGALLLIDGVDELLSRDRRTVRDWLRKLLGQYEGVRVVITSRPAAAGSEWLRKENFTALHLDRMTPPDLAAFVRQWHQAARELGGDLPCGVEELPQYEQALLSSLKDRAHLQSLASTPLLASMLCAMHLNRGRQLPRDRMELYRNALHTLVHDRDADRNVPSAAENTLSLADKLAVLRDLAWRISDNNRSEIDLDRASGYVTGKLQSMRHLDAWDGERVLDQLRHRSGILRSPADGRMDFVHRTFQEYLAAQEATEEDRIGNLVGRAHLDLWRETIIMTAGHANTRQREELLSGILDRVIEEPRHARTLRLLAASCQETLPSISDALSHRLVEAVGRLLPPRRETDPPALAAVGPSLLRWLPGSLSELNERAAALTVRTVALIGGEIALVLLAKYAEDERNEVVRELIKAWDYFDADTYGEKILNHLSLAQHRVTVNHSGQLHAASRLRQVSRVQISCPIRGLGSLATLPPLQEIWATRLRDGGDLSVIQSHPNLEQLMLFGEGPITGASAILELPELTWLAIPYPDDLELRMFSMIPALEVLSMSHIEGKDLSALTRLSKLTDLHLSINESRAVLGLEELASMTSLRGLWLYGHDMNAWLPTLKSAPPSLTRIFLSNCTMPIDGSAFSKFTNLETVTHSCCRMPDGTVVSNFDIPGVHTSASLD